jgi:signal transduction histidine kinase
MAMMRTLCWAALWAVLVGCGTAARANDSLVPIEKAMFVELGADRAEVELSLPSLTLHPKRGFRKFRLRSEFLVDDAFASKLWAVYFLSLYDGGTVAVNGVVIGRVETSTAETTVRHARPFLFHLPPDLLRSGRNQLEVQWASRETLTLVSKFFVGPAEIVTLPFKQRLFWQNDMALVAFVFAMVVALMLLIIFFLRRNQKSYLLLGLSAIGCAIVVFVYVLPVMPAWLYPYWRLLHISGIALFTQCAWLFLIRETEPKHVFFSRLCLAWGFFGPAFYLTNFWINDVSFSRLFEGVWGIGAGLIGLYPIGLLVRSVWREVTWRKVVFLAATIMAIVVGVSDIALQSTGRSTFGNVGYSLQVVSSLWLSALTSVLMADFISSLSVQDRQRKLMAQKLAEQQLELAQLHEIDRRSARARATLEERERIMQDVHDGLGSQLITSLALSERGALSAEQISSLLRESIDDLRLAIDTMSENGDRFSLAAGNLRFRMEPRLRAAGIHLLWNTAGIQDPNKLQNAQTLPLLRIIQESITNSLRHSGASEIEVFSAIQDGSFLMRISDNGKGFNHSTKHPGKGLSGIEKRARGLGASIEITGDSGTVISLRLPIEDRKITP